MILVVLGNIFIGYQCLEIVSTLEEGSKFTCDTTGEVDLVLDIGLALSGGLVGFLAGSRSRDDLTRPPKHDRL